MTAAPLDGVPIAFLGGGQMAEAMIQGMLARRAVAARQITACDLAAPRCRYLAERYGVATTADGAVAAADAAIFVLAVKPQQIAAALAPLRGRIPRDTLVLSIVAGVRAAAICAALEHRLVVRAMPSTTARVAMSATVWCATPEVPPALRESARYVLQSIGLELAVTDEDYVDIATGLTAPTPAFTFLLIEALVEAGVALGFARDAALALTLETIAGSVALMKQSGEHAAVLRGHVTSPGGATAAGLHVLEKAGLRATLSDAVRAVFERARVLGAEARP